MSKFLTPLKLEAAAVQNDDGQWMVAEPLIYQSDVAGQTFTVPAGFLTDLASVPRLPFAYWLTGGTANAAAVVHDYLYSTRKVSRKVADDVLAEASAVTGVPAWRRGLMWAAVRLFGWGPWASKEEALGRPLS